jgi:hypothetical protein
LFYVLINLCFQELDLHDIKLLDPELGATLQEMQNLVRRKKFLESSGGSKQASQALLFRDTKIEDLCLDFTLPGYPDYVLKPDGQSIMVLFNFALHCSYMLKKYWYTSSYTACTNGVGKPRDVRRVCKSCR